MMNAVACKTMKGLRRLALFAAMAGGAGSSAAWAGEAPGVSASLEAEYVADTVAVSSDFGSRIDYLGLLDVKANLPLDQGLGWQGARLFVRVEATQGGRPNDAAGTIQGIDNIEVASGRIRLFEMFLEKSIADGRGSVRLGFSDLNSEFYATEASALLIAPAFGIGSELSATGSNGPSIFPSTSLTARIHYESAKGLYVRAAAVNARTGLSDSSAGKGLFGEGALLIAEAGKSWANSARIGFGAWTYTRRQADIRDLDPVGQPVMRRAFGVYGLYEHQLFGTDARNLKVFARGGVSDGRTTPFAGGWQLGLLARGLFAARPESQVSLGYSHAAMSRRFIDNARAEGLDAHGSETVFELTYADDAASWLNIQPAIQRVRSGAHGIEGHDSWAFTLRLRFRAAPR